MSYREIICQIKVDVRHSILLPDMKKHRILTMSKINIPLIFGMAGTSVCGSRGRVSFHTEGGGLISSYNSNLCKCVMR